MCVTCDLMEACFHHKCVLVLGTAPALWRGCVQQLILHQASACYHATITTRCSVDPGAVPQGCVIEPPPEAAGCQKTRVLG